MYANVLNFKLSLTTIILFISFTVREHIFYVDDKVLYFLRTFKSKTSAYISNLRGIVINFNLTATSIVYYKQIGTVRK